MWLSNFIDYIIKTNARFDETLRGSQFGRSRSKSEPTPTSSGKFKKFDELAAIYADLDTAALTSWEMDDTTLVGCLKNCQVYENLVSKAKGVLERVLERSQAIFNGASPVVPDQHTST